MVRLINRILKCKGNYMLRIHAEIFSGKIVYGLATFIYLSLYQSTFLLRGGGALC